MAAVAQPACLILISRVYSLKQICYYLYTTCFNIKKTEIMLMECFYRFVSQNKQLFFSLVSTDQLFCETGPQTFLELGIEFFLLERHYFGAFA